MPTSPSLQPLAKRLKLDDKSINFAAELTETQRVQDDIASKESTADDKVDVDPNDSGENNCSICLEPLIDRTVIPKCSHEFCFECLLVWTEQSRRCPLCLQAIEKYLIHSIRSRYDYRKHYLPPLRTSPPRPARSNAILQNTRHHARRRRREREWSSHDRGNDESDKLERSITKRRWIYQFDLYAKHVASNSFTKFRPYPTPAQFSASQDLISRTTSFLRRELQVWEGLDIEFLTTLIISLMKAIDIRSESAVKLIAEFLDMDAPYIPGGRLVNAEHFAHEVYCYVRSPYKDLFVYDTIVQYEAPPGVEPPSSMERGRRWRTPSPPQPEPGPSQPRREGERQRGRQPSRSSERSASWSPSGRRYSPASPMRISAAWVPPQPSASNTGESSERRHTGYSHLSTEDRDEIIRADKKKSSNDESNIVVPAEPHVTPSSSLQFTEYMALRVGTRDLKGKRKAYGMDAGHLFAEPAVDDNESLDCDSTSVAQTRPANDVSSEVLKQSILQVKSSLLRAPRNKSLLDSVKAHLQSNSKNDPERAKKAQASQEAQALIVFAGEQKEANDDYPKNTVSEVMPPSNDGIGGLPQISTVEKNIDARNIGHHGASLTGQPLNFQDSPQIGPRHHHRMISPSQPMEKVISAVNNTIAVLPSCTHPSTSSSSPPAYSTRVQNCAANSYMGGDRLYLQNHHSLDGLSSINALSERVPISDELESDRSPQPSQNSRNSMDKRTRLLARLQLEKRHAQAEDRADTVPNFHKFAESGISYEAERSLLFTNHAESPLVDVDTSTTDEGHSDLPPKRERNSLVSFKAHKVEQTDPDSVPECVEEARVKEAKLRLRAQLRARLAIEKRLADASS